MFRLLDAVGGDLVVAVVVAVGGGAAAAAAALTIAFNSQKQV